MPDMQRHRQGVVVGIRHSADGAASRTEPSSATGTVPPTFWMTGGSLVLPTVILKVSEIDALLPSVAVTFTTIVPTSMFAGVPENVRVVALNDSQLGNALPFESAAA